MSDAIEIIIHARDEATKVVNGVRGALGGLGSGLKTAGTMAGGALLGIGAAAVGGFGVAMGAAINMNASLEQSTMQFTTLMGDADMAAEHVANLFEFGAKTPFETGPIIAASKHMQIFGGEALNSMENLTLVGDSAAAVGAPIDDVAFWVGRLYSNLQSGQPFGEAAARLQELGIMAPETKAELEGLQAAGASGTEVFGAFQARMGEFSGAMEMQSGSWSGMMSTLTDTLSMGAAKGLAPFFDLAKEGLAGLLEWLNSPGIQSGIQSIADGLTIAADVIKGFVGNLQEGMSPLDAFIEAIWDIAPQSVLDTLVNFRDNVLPGLLTAFHNIVDPIVTWVQNNIQLKDVLIALGIAILATVIPAVVSLALSMAPILLAIGAVIGVVALLRNAWENNWGGIQEKVAAAWAAIQPVLQVIWDWLQINIPAGLEALRAFWVDQAWPAIQGAIAWAWPIIQAIFDTLVHIIKTVIIPTAQELYHFWVDTAWPAISAALQQAWENIIKPAFEALKTFVIDTLMPAIQELATKWTEEWWPAIKTAISEAWENVIKPAFEALSKFAKETIPNAISGMRDKFNEIMGNIRSAIQPVKDVWDSFVGAIQGFWDWIQTHIFNIDISVPDLPAWATPGSPLPIHTAWADFAADMPSIAAQLDTGPIGRGVGSPATAAGAGSTTVVNIDARGAARGVDRDLRGMVEQVLREYGLRADVRMRTT